MSDPAEVGKLLLQDAGVVLQLVPDGDPGQVPQVAGHGGGGGEQVGGAVPHGAKLGALDGRDSGGGGRGGLGWHGLLT